MIKSIACKKDNLVSKIEELDLAGARIIAVIPTAIQVTPFTPHYIQDYEILANLPEIETK